jgi:predicted phosphodiesterase
VNLSGTKTVKGQIVNEAIQHYPKFGSLTIAKIILYNDGNIFDNNLESIRSLVRHYRGAIGPRSNLYKVNGRPTTPMLMPQTWREVREPYKLKPGLYLIMADVHVPFHEPKAVEAAIDYGHKNKVNGIVILGDLRDNQSFSFWPQTRKRDTDKEIETMIDFLDFLRYEFPKANIVYKLGNHEYRLPAMFYKRVPELAGIPLAAMEEILDLEGRGIDTVDYSQLIHAGKLPLMHGHEVKISTAVNPAKGLFNKVSTYAACAHFHQPSMHPGKNLQGDVLTTHSFGCLCDLHPDYNPWGNAWSWGTALLNVDKNDNFELENKRILPNGKVV